MKHPSAAEVAPAAFSIDPPHSDPDLPQTTLPVTQNARYRITPVSFRSIARGADIIIACNNRALLASTHGMLVMHRASDPRNRRVKVSVKAKLPAPSAMTANKNSPSRVVTDPAFSVFRGRSASDYLPRELCYSFSYSLRRSKSR